MAVFKGTIYVFDSAVSGDNMWTVNPHVSTDSGSDEAWELVNEIAEALVGNLLTETQSVYAVGIRNDDVLNGNQTRSVNYPGTRVTTGDILPPFNVCRIQFRASAGSRPGTFYIRPGLTEDDIVGQNLGSAFMTAANAFVAAALLVNGFCSPAGQEYLTGEANGAVQMRQLGWHRRTRPGYHRGWVPNS